MIINNSKIRSIITIIIILISANFSINVIAEYSKESDIDPLVDISVTVEIQKIRSLEKVDKQIPAVEEIDKHSDPDFYVKVFINDKEFKSPIWRNQRYIYDTKWTATHNVPDDEEFVNIKIQLWDWNIGLDRICDISTHFSDQGIRDTYDAELVYSIKTGHWYGDDSNGLMTWYNDPSGYGRLNGCDDGSIYQKDRDCELWFNIFQNDYDYDGIPYWSEVNHHNTNPEIDNTGEDKDNDGCPIEWENKWGHYMGYNWHTHEFYHGWEYDDNNYNDHKNLDPDNDGLNNHEEYLTSKWGSDPFRDDIFIELDQMEGNGKIKPSILPEESKELLFTAYNRQNLVYHLDDGCMNGGETIPFDEKTDGDELQTFYSKYFLHNNEDNWRKGVFHYGVLIYSSKSVAGAAFGSNRFYITSKGHDRKSRSPLLDRDIVYASAFMHETGHTLGFSPIGGHTRDSFYPWQKDWWKWRPYKSCMNYGYMYTTVDYSDGSRGKNDFDDWDRLDLKYFENI